MFACLELVRQLDWSADRARHGLDRLLAELLDHLAGQGVVQLHMECFGECKGGGTGYDNELFWFGLEWNLF